MMVKVENAGPCRKTLRIEVPAEEVSAAYNEVVSQFAGAARVPGFRVGRAPKDLVKRRFARDIDQEVKDRLVPRVYREALEQEHLAPVAVLGVHDVDFREGQPLAFSVTLDVPPEFELPRYKAIPLEGKSVEVADKDVDDALKDVLDQHARWAEVTGRGVQKGDLVQIDYEGVCEGKAVDEMAPKAAGLGKGKDFWMLADENAFLPGFGDGLLGAQPGEKHQVLTDFPADFAEASVAGRKCTYFVDVKAIREKQVPGLNADLLKELKVESEEQLREHLRKDLVRLRENLEKRRLKGEIIKHLLEKTKLDVPESVVLQETRDTVYDIVREQSYRGASREDIESRREEIFQAASKNATDKVKIRYILHRIAEQEKIAVAAEEVAARVAEMAAHYGMPSADLRAELQKRDAVEGLEDEIRANKALDLLLEQAAVKS